MSKPGWEPTDFAEMETYLERARQLRRDELLPTFAAQCSAVLRRLAALLPRRGTAAAHPQG